MTQFLFCPCAEHPSASPLHWVVLMRGWRFPQFTFSTRMPRKKKRKIKQPYNTASTMQLTRREASSLGHVSTEETSSPRSNWKCEIWRERWGGEKNRRTNINDLPTWVMTHCTLCSSSWTDISSSLSQHSISGCGSHPLSSPSLSPLSLSLSLRCHASSPHPSVRHNLPSDGSVIQFSPLSFFFFFFHPFLSFFLLLIVSLFLVFFSSYIQPLLSKSKQSQSLRMTMWSHSQPVSKIVIYK